jgi:hypothetical protein
LLSEFDSLVAAVLFMYNSRRRQHRSPSRIVDLSD